MFGTIRNQLIKNSISGFKEMVLPQKNKAAKEKIILCICIIMFLGGLQIRLIRLVLEPLLLRDSALYLAWADNWYTTGDIFYALNVPDYLVPPLPLWTIKSAMLVTGFGSEITARSISLFLGAILPVLGFLISLNISKNTLIALVSGVLLVFHPDLVLYSSQPLRENYYLFFFGLFLLMFTNRNISIATKCCLCSFLLAFASLCRYEAIEFIIIVPLYLLYLFIVKSIGLRKLLLCCTIFFLTYLLSCIILLSCVDFNVSFISLRPILHK